MRKCDTWILCYGGIFMSNTSLKVYRLLIYMLILKSFEHYFPQVSKWYDEIGDGYLKNKDLGDSLPAAQALQEDHLKFELQARVGYV